MLTNYFMLWCPLLLLPSVFPSIRVFSNELALRIRCQTIGASASASVLPMNIKCWFPLVWSPCSSSDYQESSPTPQFESISSSRSVFLMVQLSHLYMTIGKIIALTIQTFVGKVMSLLFNMLFTFVIAFLPRSKRLLISWLNSLSAMILEPKKIKSVTASTFSPSMCHDWKTPGMASHSSIFASRTPWTVWKGFN